MAVNLGRAQGAGFYHTSATSGTSVAISSLQPQLVPFVGDAVQFPNGDVRQITEKDDSTVTLGDVLFSYKGPQGDKGEKGDQGEKGDKGDQGEKGDKGETGDSLYSFSIIDGRLFITTAIPNDNNIKLVNGHIMFGN